MPLSLSQSDERYLELLKRTLVGLVYEEGRWQPGNTIELNGVRAAVPPQIAMLIRTPVPIAQREEGRDWPFLGYTMVGVKRLENIRKCVEHVLANDIPGDFLEAGVWRGGASMYMKALLNVHNVNDRTVWVADSFEGMPAPTALDHKYQAQADITDQTFLSVSQETVAENFRRLDLLDDRVRFLEGWFKDTLHTAPIDRLAILRMDGDLYSSTMDILRALYERVSPGGFIIADDYYAWTSCKQAVDEFRAEKQITARIEQIDWTGVFWQKN